MSEVRMINQTALLNAYGFRGGQFNTGSNIIDSISNVDIAIGASAIEGQEFNIDSALEFFTAARYGGVRVSPAAQRVINRELPPGPEGDKILAAAWLEKLSRDNTTTEACNRALAFISSRSHISVAALRSHYRQTMESRLTLVARGEFPTGTPLPDTIRPLINYVATFDGRGNLRVNDQALFNDLVSSAQSFFGRDTEKYVAYLKVIETISTNLRTNVSLTVSGLASKK